jgi:hypothetical protein
MKHAAMPVHSAHSEQVHVFATQRGVLEWHARAADGEWSTGYMATMWEILKDNHKLWHIGFSMDAMLADDEFGVVKEEMMLADTLAELVRGMLLPSG